MHLLRSRILSPMYLIVKNIMGTVEILFISKIPQQAFLFQIIYSLGLWGNRT